MLQPACLRLPSRMTPRTTCTDDGQRRGRSAPIRKFGQENRLHIFHLLQSNHQNDPPQSLHDLVDQHLYTLINQYSTRRTRRPDGNFRGPVESSGPSGRSGAFWHLLESHPARWDSGKLGFWGAADAGWPNFLIAPSFLINSYRTSTMLYQ